MLHVHLTHVCHDLLRQYAVVGFDKHTYLFVFRKTVADLVHVLSHFVHGDDVELIWILSLAVNYDFSLLYQLFNVFLDLGTQTTSILMPLEWFMMKLIMCFRLFSMRLFGNQLGKSFCQSILAIINCGFTMKLSIYSKANTPQSKVFFYLGIYC